MTNLDKEREEIIYELLLSLNNGNSSCVQDRVELAINQYNALVENKIIIELCDHEWKFVEQRGPFVNMGYEHKWKCTKCGETEIRRHPFNV